MKTSTAPERDSSVHSHSRCPACGAPVNWSERPPHRPFCSERCRTLDLGAWAGEEYRIPVASDPFVLATESPVEDP
ncbi:MAG: DNA gyrase inhibitor YacG [Kistimonas sp.]|nr:DNA gyrase inhibitor YacG [Kistimonas sp.]